MASTPAVAPREFILHKGDKLPPATPREMNDPSARFVRVYGSDLLSGLMGATSVSYGTGKPDEVKLRFDTVENARLGDAALKDSVLGAKLVFTDPSGTPYDLGTGYTGSPANIARNVAALPGVVSWRTFGQSSILMVPDSVDTRVKFQQLVNRSFGDRFAYWKGECFGPGCPVDPTPPTGEV